MVSKAHLARRTAEPSAGKGTEATTQGHSVRTEPGADLSQMNAFWILVGDSKG